jgi:hypothetical protein
VKLVLLHSPLAVPDIWESVAPDLRARGHHVAVPELTPILAGGGPYYPRFADDVADAIGPEPSKTYLIAHSNAGALVPAIAARAALAGVVFVDAVLPYPGRSWLETVPVGLAAHVRGLAEGGCLPPWNCWWPEKTMTTVLPDAAMRDRIFAALPQVPLAYLEERAPDAALATQAAYLLLSPGYHTEAGQAETAGWPVVRMSSQQTPLQHLAMLTHPRRVAAKIESLAARLRRLSERL